jgi:hypothetical protein
MTKLISIHIWQNSSRVIATSEQLDVLKSDVLAARLLLYAHDGLKILT